LNSVSKLPYPSCADGISNTFSITAPSLGKSRESQISNLVAMLDGYFARGAQHLNVNCMTRDVLVDAMEHPDKYPTLTIRVSGYAVNFIKLSREHQEEVISRTFHASL
jgi:formate C-acetyltransferase